ncbi:HEAT repeat domain-containing protein, partial [Streptomyces sp. NPDC056061]|uniref:HEAT repeat domain-containing protein n=1 Tax=Streptomyces sp. NPDC056061 TaxID=3345700 RepID=UPI0035DC119B
MKHTFGHRTTLGLLRSLAAEPGPDFRDMLGEANARPDLVASVRHLLRNGSRNEKRIALLALRAAPAPDAATTARTALPDADPQVRLLAMEFLTDASADTSRDLVRMLDDPEPEVRSRAMSLLLRLEPVPRAIRSMLDSPDERLRASVIEAIDDKSTRRLLDDLRPGLRSPAPRVRIAALDALTRL